jgi:predicted peptidase
VIHIPQKVRGKLPMILFLHGAGERGQDLAKVGRHGPLKFIADGGSIDAVVVAPQAPDNEAWSVTRIDQVLQTVVEAYPVDTMRIVVTGLSMGGIGTWDAAVTFPNRFAAIAPICGVGNWLAAPAIRDLPIWAFHGALDPVIPIERTSKMIAAILECGGSPRFTVDAAAFHDAWSKPYSDKEFYEWLLSHERRVVRETQENQYGT